MNELSKVISELLPDIASQNNFKESKNSERIEKNIEMLGKLSHGVNISSQTEGTFKDQDMDPSLLFLSDLFSSEVKRAAVQFKSGNYEYARSVIRGVTGFCVACHTRGQSGPQFPALDWASSLSGLTPFERAELFAATRQFDRAFDEYLSIISNSEILNERQIEWERSIRHALAIAVRVKAAPLQALKVVDQILFLPKAPLFVKQDAKLWKSSIQTWKKEIPRKITTAGGMWAEAKRLIAKANLVQKYPTDRSADIWYLRASKVVHDYLRVTSDTAKTAEALFLAGVCYEALGDLRLWSLSDVYFEACVRKYPHSKVARSCYQRYEQSVFAGYSGSSGISIPQDIKAQLAELRTLADLLKK